MRRSRVSPPGPVALTSMCSTMPNPVSRITVSWAVTRTSPRSHAAMMAGGSPAEKQRQQDDQRNDRAGQNRDPIPDKTKHIHSSTPRRRAILAAPAQEGYRKVRLCQPMSGKRACCQASPDSSGLAAARLSAARYSALCISISREAVRSNSNAPSPAG